MEEKKGEFMISLLVYIAHPYAGDEQNEKKVEEFIGKLQKYKGVTFISPIHTFGRQYNNVKYQKGIEDCLSLLDKCDILAIPKFEEIQHSKACLIEYGFAKGAEIGIVYWDELESYLQAYEVEEEE